MRRMIIGVVALALATLGLPGAAASAALPMTLTLIGHGYGHGRGMGQYGAFGYALMGESSPSILAHYYGGTQPASVNANQLINVDLLEYYGAAPVTVNGVSYARTSGDLTIPTTSPATVSMSGEPTRTYQGAIVLKGGAYAGQVWNVVPLDRYVAGVVPAESIASWGAYGGEAALQAQAVAARSYALAKVAADGVICDTTRCQVYDGDPGAAGSPTNSPYTAYSDYAVASTAGQVLDCGTDSACGAPGQVALTEYSSSSGGYSAGGTFPAVPDAGDGYAGNGNPNHDWSASVPASQIQAVYAGQVGTVQSVAVTQRNGLGDLGGRVLQVALSGTAGQVTVPGAAFADALGLLSNWFAFTNTTAASGGDNGYWVAGADGGVYAFGAAASLGSMTGQRLNAPVIGVEGTPSGNGYWLVAGDGGIFSFGDANFYGSTGNLRLNAPVLGMTATAGGGGYWLYAGDGGIFSFGDANFYGSTGNLRLNAPVVGMAATPGGGGYWLVAADGGVFSFGNARFYGSTGNLHLNAPVVGMVATADGGGYWLVAADGGVFSFGDAGYVGSLPGLGITDTIVAVAPTASGNGYLLLSRGGRVYSFGDAPYYGDPADSVAGWNTSAVGIAAHEA